MGDRRGKTRGGPGVDRGSESPEPLEIRRGSVEEVRAETVTVRQGGVQFLRADRVSIRQGGVVDVESEHFEMLQGGVVASRSDSAQLTASQAGLIHARGPVTMEQSASMAVLAGGDVAMSQCGSVAMVARDVRADHCGAVLLLANRVEGEVHTVLGPREALLLGAAAGALAGLALLLRRRFQD